MHTRLDGSVTTLRLAFGLMAALAGLDKYFNILADWSAYISPLAVGLLPVGPETFMAIVGVVELAVGIAVLGAAPRLGAYLASGWLLLIAVNLALAGYLDIAVRDVVLSISAFTLAEVLESQRTPAHDRARPARGVAVA